MGVQWHPELGWERDRFSQSLFELFVERAVDFAENNAKHKTSTLAHS
jgi:gamma-glutamyl-gamma-aminobutyrate hydrolase PuuD